MANLPGAWPYPRVLAHRGGGTLAPENTLAGLREGLRCGYRAIEYDIMLARDGVPVVMHDPYLGRTVAGSGNVFDYDAAELALLDAGGWFAREHEGEPVPLFVEFAGFCKAHGVWMNMEIKPAPEYDIETGGTVARIAAALFADEIAAGEMDRVPLLSSFSMLALEAAREVAPQVPRACLMSELPPDWERRAQAVEAVAIHTNHRHLTPQLAQEVRTAGYGLFCYTVNGPARARELLAWGVDAFCTDRIDLIGPYFA
ncbi:MULTISPECIES: glycerophosphodiester phosphodiesterase [unclassified Massilia]|uniref:glycerophosphodiester phosphodiesterase n=1 Tax=unclassified Massilia TaxID=2609279 RepID=UPI0017841BE8|nr:MULTISPECIES: glycerophosphodiester phosphodiesterase [unclassified Massilia]MBD8531995.1 glycerophosphodiester phosphodiesterase [Massilia sp. CFBP 13647]MBD8675391.1 glycerophosphodiester phosphodiesterase [Massilia sp. CFBP 13721]